MKTKLKQWGAVLLVFGAASLVLPLIGMQLKIFNLFGEAQKPASIAAIVLGAVMWFLGRRAERASAGVPLEEAGAPPAVPERGPSGAKKAPESAQGAATCPACGAAVNPGDRFCMECGRTIPEVAVATPVPVAAPAPRRPRKLVRKLALVLLLGLVAAGAWFFFGSSNSYTPPSRSQPAMPAVLAGTLTEFPVDSLGTNGLQPVSMTSQSFEPAGQAAWSSATRIGPYTPPPPPLGSWSPTGRPAASAPGIQAPANSLPPGLDTNAISQVATAMTSCTYRSSDLQSAPVHVHVLQIGQNIGILAQWLQAIAQSLGATIQGARVQSPQGQTYEGYTLRAPASMVNLLINPQKANLIILYTPQADGIPALQRLAGNVGNGFGLLRDYPQTLDTYTTLPATAPAGYQLTSLRTFTGSDLREIITQSQGQLSKETADTVDKILAKVRMLIPERGTIAVYNNGQGQEKGVLIGKFASPRKANLAWKTLAYTAGWGMEKNKQLGFDALVIKDQSSRVLLFQKGPYIGMTKVPMAASEQELLDLVKSLQV